MLDKFKTKLAKTDVSVEAMRCIAAFMVVIIHTMLPTMVDGQIMPFRTYISCVIGDAVAVFWLIAGFFMFSEKKTYPQMIKRGLINIGIPTVLLFLFAFFFYDFFVNGVTLAESFSHPLHDYKEFIHTLMYWNPSVPETAVSWYMFVYALVLVFWPVLNAFVMKYLKGNNRNQLIFMGITFLLFTWNEVGKNMMLEFSHHALGGVVPASILMIWGWILYQHKDIFKSRKLYGLIAIAVFFITNLVRLHFQLDALSVGNTENLPLYWYTPFAMICASCVAIACISLIPSEPSTIWQRIVVILGGTTLTIYLAHFMIKDTLRAHFGPFLLDFFYQNGQPLLFNQSLTDCVYLFVNASMICIIGVAVAFVFKAAYSLIQFGFQKIKQRGDTAN